MTLKHFFSARSPLGLRIRDRPCFDRMQSRVRAIYPTPVAHLLVCRAMTAEDFAVARLPIAGNTYVQNDGASDS